MYCCWGFLIRLIVLLWGAEHGLYPQCSFYLPLHTYYIFQNAHLLLKRIVILRLVNHAKRFYSLLYPFCMINSPISYHLLLFSNFGLATSCLKNLQNSGLIGKVWEAIWGQKSSRAEAGRKNWLWVSPLAPTWCMTPALVSTVLCHVLLPLILFIFHQLRFKTL